MSKANLYDDPNSTANDFDFNYVKPKEFEDNLDVNNSILDYMRIESGYLQSFMEIIKCA